MQFKQVVVFHGVFSPCKINDDLLVDGGIAENIPWKETKNAGADKVISIIFKDKIKNKSCKNILEVISKSITVISKELAKYEWDGSDYLLEIKTQNVGLLEKKKMDKLYYEGYFQAKSFIKENKLNNTNKG